MAKSFFGRGYLKETVSMLTKSISRQSKKLNSIQNALYRHGMAISNKTKDFPSKSKGESEIQLYRILQLISNRLQNFRPN